MTTGKLPVDSEGSAVISTESEPLALRRRDAARMLGLSERALWSLTNRGDVPHVRLGKSIRYPVAALRDWLAKRTRGGK
jgi:predicted DNA-binding transcriptional regulator AlpA